MSKNIMSDVSTYWYDYPGKNIVLHTLKEGSAEIATKASELLLMLERAINELAKILNPPQEKRNIPLHLYLLDVTFSQQDTVVFDAEHDPLQVVRNIHEDAIVYTVHQDEQDEQLLIVLSRTLVKRWMGNTNEGIVSFFADGLAGIVASTIGVGPTLAEREEMLKSRLKEEGTLSIFSRPVVTEQESTKIALNSNVATSFIAYLLQQFGNTALQQFFLTTDTQREDQATLVAYHRPLGQLEENWLKHLRKAARPQSTAVLFVRYIFPLLKPYRVKTIKILLYLILGLASNVVLPLSARYLLDAVIPSKSLTLLLFFSLGMLCFFILNTAIGLRRSQLTSIVVQNIVADLQQKNFDHLQKLSHEFYNRAKVGDLMARMSEDVRMVAEALSQVINNGFTLVCGTIVSIVVLLSLQPLIGVLVILVIPLVVISYNVLGKRLQLASMDIQRLVGETATMTQEAISAHAVIKAFGLEQQMVSSYRSRLLAELKAAIRLDIIAAFFQNSLIFASLVEQLIVLGIGAYLVITGHITIGTLLAAWSVLPTLLAPLSTFGIIAQVVQAASGSMERIIELQEEPITVPEKANAVELPPFQQTIRFEHVGFAYEKNRPILKDLHLSIEAGTNIAIVGPSGSGKSSLINLLTRFWDPTVGRILIDEHDLQDVSLTSLRAQIGLVFQDTFVFDTTVRENLAISCPGATDQEIFRAAQMAQLDEYIQTLPAGYNTVLGERGVRMSGGQRQRLAIARALLRNPRILILDEATSALDAQTEREILETLETLKRGRTTISITHRLSTAAGADRILVLDHGELVEQGTHEALMQTNGLYRKLYEEQMHSTQDAKATNVDEVQLRSIPLFKEMSTEVFEKVTAQLVPMRFAMGEDIVNQGEVGDAFYIIHFGQVEVLFGNDGTRRRINILDEGDFFGEMALLADEPRTASVRATFPTECYVLTKAAFTQLLDQDAQVRDFVWRVARQRRKELAAIEAYMKRPNHVTNLLKDPSLVYLKVEQPREILM